MPTKRGNPFLTILRQEFLAAYKFVKSKMERSGSPRKLEANVVCGSLLE